MKLPYKNVTSPVFILVETYEFQVEIGEDEWPTRVELFEAINKPNTYRARIWQTEFFRIQPTFSHDDKSDPKHEPSDEEIQIDQNSLLAGDFSQFTAKNREDALNKVVNAMSEHLEI